MDIWGWRPLLQKPIVRCDGVGELDGQLRDGYAFQQLYTLCGRLLQPHKVVKHSPPSNDTTCQRFMKILIRSLKLAESGKSESGEFLAGGYYLVVIGTKCDYDHLVNHWQMPGHWQHAHPCAWCPCDRSSTSMGFRNTKPDAAWRPLSFSVSGNDAWRAHCRLVKKSPCALFCRHAVLNE